MPKLRSHSPAEGQESTAATITELQTTIQQLEADVQQAKEQTLRSQADYQNLVRRNQEERIKVVKLATQDLVTALLEPLDHLEMAAAQLQDKGLHMVVDQFHHVLHEYGVAEIEALGKPFDVHTMEAVERKDDDSDVVVAVRRKGYQLNGEVIRHAKVIVGSADHLNKEKK